LCPFSGACDLSALPLEAVLLEAKKVQNGHRQTSQIKQCKQTTKETATGPSTAQEAMSSASTARSIRRSTQQQEYVKKAGV